MCGIIGVLLANEEGHVSDLRNNLHSIGAPGIAHKCKVIQCLSPCLLAKRPEICAQQPTHAPSSLFYAFYSFRSIKCCLMAWPSCNIVAKTLRAWSPQNVVACICARTTDSSRMFFTHTTWWNWEEMLELDMLDTPPRDPAPVPRHSLCTPTTLMAFAWHTTEIWPILRSWPGLSEIKLV